MSDIWKRLRTLGTPSPIEMTYMVRVSRDEEEYSNRDSSHITAKIDFYARNLEGQKVFESFHIITVPTGEFNDRHVLRKELKRSLKHDLQRLVGNLGHYN